MAQSRGSTYLIYRRIQQGNSTINRINLVDGCLTLKEALQRSFGDLSVNDSHNIIETRAIKLSVMSEIYE